MSKILSFFFQNNNETFRTAALIRVRRLFQFGYPEVRRLLEGGAYLKPAAY